MKVLLIAVLLLLSVLSFGQSPNIRDARSSGYQVIVPPNEGTLKVEVSEEYHNMALIYICDDPRSIPIACREDYQLKMTTSTGRVVTITDYTDRSFGTIHPNEFPLMVDVKVQGLRGQERYPLGFSIKLLYPDFCYRIYLYDKKD